ncbi:PREDICTED: protein DETOXIFICATION 35-like [Camelina sativa]|uniref:Protein DETOXIFICATION 35-like n=1 Tax=Camelina sativa TaxID=90675 RepID=A0ABM1QKQ8_CAMSA|nr:PREDICTED: protein DETOXIFICATION 35-like [Camelina sativa]
MDPTTPLLTDSGQPEEDYAPARSWTDVKRVLYTESAKMWLIAAPVGFNIICQYGVSSVTNIFVGHIGEIELSAVSISLSVIGSFSFGFLLGMGSALETLCGQAYGAGQVNMLGVYMQRSWIILFVSCWTGLSWLAFKDIWAFVRLSIASAVMLCLEIWYMMSIIVLTGRLDNAVIAVDSLSICMNVNGLEAMLFIGINAAIRLCLCHRHRVSPHWSYLYGGYHHSQRPFFNHVHKQQSVAVGGGWQGLVAYINLGCYYIFGLPFGYLLGYKANFGVMGLWSGMIAGTALQTLLLLIVLYKTNWNKEVEETMERMKKWGGSETTSKDVTA